MRSPYLFEIPSATISDPSRLGSAESSHWLDEGKIKRNKNKSYTWKRKMRKRRKDQGKLQPGESQRTWRSSELMKKTRTRGGGWGEGRMWEPAGREESKDWGSQQKSKDRKYWRLQGTGNVLETKLFFLLYPIQCYCRQNSRCTLKEERVEVETHRSRFMGWSQELWEDRLEETWAHSRPSDSRSRDEDGTASPSPAFPEI